MKKRFLKATALVLCGLLAMQSSVMPAFASEETTHEEIVEEAERRGEWTSTWLDYGPGSDSDYTEIKSGSGTVDTGCIGEQMTAIAASAAIAKAISSINPQCAAGVAIITGIIQLTPQMVVDGFEKYAPLDTNLDYTYKLYKNEKDSTIMYEYYRYEVTYLIGDQSRDVTFYETRTFN